MTRRKFWSLCPAGHGLDYEGQPCDLCPAPPEARTASAALRPEVLAFARVMSAKIDGHNHDRGEHGWRTATPARLMEWLEGYVTALSYALDASTMDAVTGKAANVANLAMMIADVCGGLASPPPPPGEPKRPPPTHRCKVCGALWIENPPSPAQPGGSWSLWSRSCGKCCDNVAMGEQIERITGWRPLCDPGPWGDPPPPGKCVVCGGDPDDRHDGPGHSICPPTPGEDASPESAGAPPPARGAMEEIEGLVENFERAIYGPDGAWLGNKAAEEIDGAKADLLSAVRRALGLDDGRTA